MVADPGFSLQQIDHHFNYLYSRFRSIYMSNAVKLIMTILIALMIPIIPFVIVGELPGEQWVSGTDEHALMFAVTGALLLCSDVLLPVPSSIVGSLLGARLGFLEGFICAWIGLCLGSVIGYFVGMLWPNRMSAQLPETPTLTAVFLSRPVPVLAEAVSVVAGSSRIAFYPFLAVSALGNACYAAVLALNGALSTDSLWAGPGLILPMLLPVATWLIWHKVKYRNKANLQ